MNTNMYYRDYLNGYIRIYDIPYKYWNNEIISLALKKEPYNYYEQLLSLSLRKEIMATPEDVIKSMPEEYRTDRIYQKLLEYDYGKYRHLVPKKQVKNIAIKKVNNKDLITEFKNIPEKDRTPAMYRELSKISIEDYLMYVVNYYDIPDKERNKERCLRMFFANIDKYINRIPSEYKTQELCDLLVKLDFEKYFSYVPEKFRTKEMYEEYVKLNPGKHIKEVPEEKRSQVMYNYLFNSGFDNYFELIPEKFRTKEMYHRLARINYTKYIGKIPEKYMDANIAVEAVKDNISNLKYIHESVKNEEFYLKLIKLDPIRYIKYLPAKYYTEDMAIKIGNIILNSKDNHRITSDLAINKLIIDKFPRLLGRFSDKIIMKIIKDELCMMLVNNQSIDIITDRYGISNRSIINILLIIKEEDIKLYKNINEKINAHNAIEYKSVIDDIAKLEVIINSLGQVSRRKLTSEKKQEIAYLIKKYIHTPLEVIYTYNNSYLKENASETINYFIEYVLEYSLLIDRYEGLSEFRKISYENPWLKDFDINKHFSVINGVPTSTYKYGEDEKELTFDLATEIINKLNFEAIPLNSLIVSIAFRKYFKGELDNYIEELHNYDKIFEKSKRKKREV